MKNFVRLFFLLVLKILAKVKPSQIDWFLIATWRRACRVVTISYCFQRVYMSNSVLHIVHAEPRVIPNWAFATQIASNTHILRSLGDILPEDVLIRGNRRSALDTHRSARFESDRRALIFELRVKELKWSECVVSWSLTASIGQKREHLELLTDNELIIVEIENVVMWQIIYWRLKEASLASSMVLQDHAISE